jgi:hypothetical protein
MYYTFGHCYNLSGDVFIYSENVSSCYGCFDNILSNINAYIPFYDENDNYTTTYNSFINEYNGSKLVTLKDPIAPRLYFAHKDDLTKIYLNSELKDSDTCYAKRSSNEVIFGNDEKLVIKHYSNLNNNQQYNVNDNLNNISFNRISMNINDDCEVIFKINGINFNAYRNNNLYYLDLNTDEELTIDYEIYTSNDYSDVFGQVTFNNSNIEVPVTLENVTWLTWTRPDLTADGTIGGNSFAVNAKRYNSQYAYYAVDSDPSTYWRVDSDTVGNSSVTINGGMFSYTMYNPNRFKVNGFVISTSTLMTEFAIKCSNDGVNWKTEKFSYVKNTDYEITILNPKPYKYYEIRFGTSSSSLEVTDIGVNAEIKQ